MDFFKLKGKKAFIAGIGDDAGYGWAIAKMLAAHGVELYIGTWAPIYNIFTTSLKNGKFDDSRKLPDGTLMQFAKIYPMDAAFDAPEDVPAELKENKRYAALKHYTLSEVKEQLKKDTGTIDFFVHSLANAPEVKNDLLDTSRSGYLAAFSASSYSLIAVLKHFGPLMNEGGGVVSLTYIASERVIPGYGGGMSSAKAALESDTRTLSFEAGRKWGIRVNTISAGPLRSRAARAIGLIDRMVAYSKANSPLAKDLDAEEVGAAALFLLSPMASAVTGVTLYVDNGMHAMGVATDSISFADSSVISTMTSPS